MAEFCMSCGCEFQPTPERQCQCIGCDALRRLADLEKDSPDELTIGSEDLCFWTPEDAEFQGYRRGRAVAAKIARGAFDEMRAVAP